MYKQMQIAAITYIAFLTMANAQRPSYAGSRPTGGLNQKDKYHNTQNQNGITTTNTLAFGVPQKPPMNGTPIVRPHPVYIPLPPRQQDNDIASRFGAPDAAAGSASGTVSGINTTQKRLPFDAHGDQELINQLSRLPVDKRPFWFLNYQAIEAQRNGSANNFAGAVGSRGSFFG